MKELLGVLSSSRKSIWRTHQTYSEDAPAYTLASYGDTFAVIGSHKNILGYYQAPLYTTANPYIHWSKTYSTLGNEKVTALDKCGSYWVAGVANGLFTSTVLTGTWTRRLTGSSDINKVIYSSTASLYIAIGNNGNLYTATSPTSSWTSRTSNFGTNNICDIYDNGSLIVIVGFSAKIATSTDGTTWTLRTNSFSESIKGVVYAKSLWVFVGHHTSNIPEIATSSDPTSSITMNTSTGLPSSGLSLEGIAYSSNQFVAVASNPLSIISTTSPASSWISEDITHSNCMYAKITTNNKYFGVLISQPQPILAAPPAPIKFYGRSV